MNEFEIVSGDDADESDAVICVKLTSPLLMPDNLIDLCSECGEAIQHRPHIPKRPPKICIDCALPMTIAAAAKGELHAIITPETAADVAAHLRKKNAH
jgi:hypothetical protein